MSIKTVCFLVFLGGLCMPSQVSAQPSEPSDWYTQYYARLRTNDPLRRENQAKEVMQDNELLPIKAGRDIYFYANPLLLDGKLLDYSRFDFGTQGMLSVVLGNPESKDAEPISFYVSVRRNGTFVQDKKMKFLNKPLYKISLTDIFPFCRLGDVMIIHPVRAEHWRAKRILKLIGGC